MDRRIVVDDQDAAVDGLGSLLIASPLSPQLCTTVRVARTVSRITLAICAEELLLIPWQFALLVTHGSNLQPLARRPLHRRRDGGLLYGAQARGARGRGRHAPAVACGCSAARPPWAWASGRCTSSACWRISVEIPLRYGIFKTVLSLVIAMITSGFALAIASRPQLSLARLAIGSVVMGAGICAMHYSGMAAIQIVPMITLPAAAGRWRRSASRWARRSPRCGWRSNCAAANPSTSRWRAPARPSSWDWPSAACTTPPWRPRKLAVGAYCFGGAAFDNNWLAGTIGLVALGILGAHADHRGLRRAPAVADAQGRAATRAGQRRACSTARTCWRWPRARPAFPPGNSTSPRAARCGRKTKSNRCAAAGIDTRAQPDAIMAMTHPEDRSIMFDAINAGRGGEEGGLRLPLPRGDSGGQRRAPRGACAHLLR